MAITYHAGRRIQGINSDVASSQGYAGGDCSANAKSGGGGAGAVGNPQASSTVGGDGGAGLSSSITGSPVPRAGGGGGASWSTSTNSAGGIGGGGIGSQNTGTAGSSNTGSGGGGGGEAGGSGNNAGGAGGSGIVIISYEGSQAGSGGTVTTNTSVTPNRTVHTFLLAQTGTSFTPTSAYNVEYLVIAGGGGGGGGLGGGGGAGGYRTATGFGVTAQAYTITVGAGGAGAPASNSNGSSGGDSVFSTITSTGGGYGSGEGQGNGGAGGSGGGAGGNGSSGGISSTYDTKPTNVQVGSRFEETDTRKMYHYFAGDNGSITKDTQAIIQHGTAGTGAPDTFSSFTVANNNNRILILACGMYNSSPDITSVTWNSNETFTKIASEQRSSYRCELWYLINPTATTASCVIGSTGMGQMGACLYSFYNVAQTSSIGTPVTKDEASASTTPFINITPVNTGSMIIDAWYNGAGSPVPNNAETDGMNIICGGVDRGMASQYDLTPTIGSVNSMSRTSGTDGYCQVAVEIKKSIDEWKELGT